MKFNKGYNLKIVTVLLSIVFLCNTSLYSYPVSKDSLRPSVGEDETYRRMQRLYNVGEVSAVDKLSRRAISDSMAEVGDFSEEVLDLAKEIGVDRELETYILVWLDTYRDTVRTAPRITANFIRALGYTASTGESIGFITDRCLSPKTVLIRSVAIDSLVNMKVC